MRVIGNVNDNKPILLDRVLGWLGIPSIDTGVAEHLETIKLCTGTKKTDLKLVYIYIYCDATYAQYSVDLSLMSASFELGHFSSPIKF